jgi:hypothetical protein
MSEWKKEFIDIRHDIEKIPVPIISNGVVGQSGFSDGKMIPVLIIDTSNRKDIDDMIRAHRIENVGDVDSTWEKPKDIHKFKLWLMVKKPSRCLILLEINIVTHGVLVEQIIEAQGLYLQPGRPGDRLSKTMDHPRLLLEIPSRDFRNEWEQIWKKALFNNYREQGVPRGKAKEATENLIKQWRQIGSMRIPSG